MAAKQVDTTECNGENSKISDTKLRDSNIQPSKVMKRENYLQWDEYFMAVAFLSAQRSKDPNSQVGACIVNEDKKIVGIGYNGMPNGCSDDLLPWARKADDDLDTKYPYGMYFTYQKFRI
jgi:dCMP deaminase